MTVALSKQQGALIVAGVFKKHLLTPDIIHLILEYLTPFEFFSSQIFNLKRSDGLNPPLFYCKYPAPNLSGIPDTPPAKLSV
ncbi:MAG: hypothetical protein QX198_00415 [Methylococcaceae bacterium]